MSHKCCGKWKKKNKYCKKCPIILKKLDKSVIKKGKKVKSAKKNKGSTKKK